MAEDQVAAAALDVEAPVDPAEGEAASNRYKGGFKPEHRQTPVVKRSPYSVTQGYSAVARVLIPPAEKALLFVIFSKVDSETWRWPPKHMELKRGSSVLELATLIGRSVRHTRRLLRKLEARGVLITYDRRPYRSEYQVVPEVLMELGRMGHQAVRDVLAADRDAAVATQAAADCRIDRAVGAPEEDAAPKADLAPPVAEELPFWANQLGRKHDLKPEFAAGLVRAAWRAAGEQGLWTREGGTGRMTVKVWRGLGEPGLDEWEALLESLASAVKAGRMNGLLPRNWSGHQTNLVRLAQNGEARRVAALHMAPPPPPAAVQRDSQSGSVRIEGHMLLPAMRTLERWNAEKAQVRSQLGTMLYDTWFRALEWVGLDGDETVVQAPNGVFGKWCAEHYSAVLAHMAGGPVRLQWEG